jgi:FKBP12-rapamycin complex-associated protein
MLPDKQMAIESVDDNQADKSQGSDVSLLMAGLGPSSEDYFPTVVINALLKILKDPSLGQQYQYATQAIVNIFQALQLKMVPFLPQVTRIDPVTIWSPCSFGYLHLIYFGCRLCLCI